MTVWRLRLFLLTLLLLETPPGLVGATTRPRAARWACDGWQSYVVGPSGRDLAPVRSVQRSGGGELELPLLAAADGAGVRLARHEADGSQLVLDFGQVVTGKLELDFLASSAPLVVFSFSESLQHLRPGSDTRAYANGDLAHSPGTGGQSWHSPRRRTFRYLLISLAEDGWVELDRVGLYFTAALAPPEAFQGSFLSSDPELNRIWYRSAYTLQLVTAPGTSTDLDGVWEIWRGQLDVASSTRRTLGLTAPGADWRDYSLKFDLTLAPGSQGAGWTVRASERAFPAFRLVPGSGGSASRFESWLGHATGANLVRQTKLPMALAAGKSYRVEVRASGDEISTWLDGQLADVGRLEGFPVGRVGLWAIEADHFTVDNVRVMAPDGRLLFEDSFDEAYPSPTRWAEAAGPMLLDGAKRDRALGLADLAIAARTGYMSLDRTALVRELLWEVARHQHPSGKLPAGMLGPERFAPEDANLPDYSFWWVLSLHDYVMHSGDEPFLGAVFPNLESVMAWAGRGRQPNGLLAKGPGTDWYWSADRGQGATTALNALYFGALNAAAALAARHGRPELAGLYLDQAVNLRAAVNEVLWDPSVGAYSDGEALRGHHPLDGNALAVLHGLAKDEQANAALAYLRSALWSEWGSRTADRPYGSRYHDLSIWPAYVYQEVEARFQSGDDSGALELIRRTWGNMLARDPASVFWELAAPDGSIPDGFASLAHGWSTGALPALTRHVLGVRPTAPGYAGYVVAPHPSGLEWACGQVPTPRGALKVAWSLADGRFTLVTESPRGAVGSLAVPWRDATWQQVWLDGRLVWPAFEADAAVRLDEGSLFLYVDGVGAGRHRLEAISHER